MGQEQGLLLEAQDVIRSKGDSSITAIEKNSINFVFIISDWMGQWKEVAIQRTLNVPIRLIVAGALVKGVTMRGIGMAIVSVVLGI